MSPKPDASCAPSAAIPKGASGSWWDYVGSRTGGGGAADDEGTPARRSSAMAFWMHARKLQSAPTLDVDVVPHCNLNCVSCCHFSPAAAPGFLSLEDYERDLRQLARVEGIATYFGAIVLMGGEPLLHPELPEFVRLTRRHLPEARLWVTSNGLLLGSMGPAFWDALRAARCELNLTWYPTGLDYEALVALARSRGVRAGIVGGPAEGEAISHFLRTPLDAEGRQDPRSSFSACPLGGCSLQLLNGKIFPCNRGALLGVMNERFGTAFVHEADDYLELSALRDLEDIERMRRASHPMCRYCATSLDERVAWRRSQVAPDEWLMRTDERQRLSAQAR